MLVCLCALLSAGCAFSLSGCLESKVLVNFVLDPSSENIDYDNPEKIYVPDQAAELTSQDIAKATNKTTREIEEVLYDEAVFNTKKDNTDEEAESGVLTKTKDSATTASKQEISAVGKEIDSGSDNTDTDSDDEDGGSDGAGEAGESDPDQEGDGDSKTTDPGEVFNGNGKVEDLPTDVKSVCATGGLATIVAAIAGPEYLVGSSEEYLDSGGAGKVFGDRGLNKAEVCWNGDGTDKSDAIVGAITSAKPSAVFVSTGGAALSAADQKTLIAAGISIVPMPSMASDSYIRKAVRAVGKMFSDVTDGESEKRAQSYIDTVDKVLKAAKDTHGGSACSYNNVDYNNVTDANPTDSSTAGATRWTVLLTGWDADAKATASFNGKSLFTSKGVALAKIGWRWSPVSYYLGCGGVVNNAAAYGSYAEQGTYASPSQRLFLSYNENQVSYSWSGLSSSVTVGKDGGSFSQGGACVLANACDTRGNTDTTEAHRLGSQDYNKVIVTTSGIKSKLESARKESLGLYTPGSYQSATSVAGYGLDMSGVLLMTYNTSSYDVVVNPCGLVGSWTEGSMESFLEAAWAAQQFCGYNESQLEDDITGFYKDFYGYDLSSSELSSILSGKFAQD